MCQTKHRKLESPGLSQPNVRISQNLRVHGDKGYVENASRCYNDLIRRVTMKGTGEHRGFNADARREIEQANTRIRQCLRQPIGQRAW